MVQQTTPTSKPTQHAKAQAHPPTTLPPLPTNPTTCSPPLHHLTHLLHSLSHSESNLFALRSHLASELGLLQNYFTTSTAYLQNELTPAARAGGRESREKAAGERRRKWAEMEAMRGYERGLRAVSENVERREEVERMLRGRLGECVELMVLREELGREVLGLGEAV